MFKLSELFQDHQLYHSEFQQDYFITARSGGTLYGMYKQSVRELYKRWRGLKQLYADHKLAQVDIDELQHKISSRDGTGFDFDRNQINLEKKTADIAELEKNISDTEREFKRFYQQACVLKQQLGELTDKKRNQLDREMWFYKIKEMAGLDILSCGRIQRSTIECALSCNVEDRKKILKEIKDHESLIEWMETKQDILSLKTDELEMVEMPDIKLLEG
jgi:hypothetical protein